MGHHQQEAPEAMAPLMPSLALLCRMQEEEVVALILAAHGHQEGRVMGAPEQSIHPLTRLLAHLIRAVAVVVGFLLITQVPMVALVSLSLKSQIQTRPHSQPE
jgi:hypothetical protein